MTKYVGGLVLVHRAVGEQTKFYLTFANNRDAESHTLSLSISEPEEEAPNVTKEP